MATPGGTVAWAPRDGPGTRKLLAARAGSFETVTDPRIVLDGDALPIEQGFAETWIYMIPVGRTFHIDVVV